MNETATKIGREMFDRLAMLEPSDRHDALVTMSRVLLEEMFKDRLLGTAIVDALQADGVVIAVVMPIGVVAESVPHAEADEKSRALVDHLYDAVSKAIESSGRNFKPTKPEDSEILGANDNQPEGQSNG